MKKYLITGATSMLGSALTNELSKDNIVYAVVRKETNKLNNINLNNNVKLLFFDMNDYRNIFIDGGLDGVFHFAWEGARGAARNDKDIQKNNYESSKSFFDAILKMHPSFFFGIGSQGEYGDYRIAYSESLECNPTTEYGKNKNSFLHYLEAECPKNNIRLLWGRVFSAYGKNDFPNSLLMSTISKMKNNSDVDLSPCEHIWSFTYYKDIIKAIILLVSNNCEGVYNITDVDNILLKDYVLQLQKITGSKSKLNFGVYKYNGNIPNMIADNAKLVKDTGYKPDYTFEKGIKELLRDINYENN